MALTLLTAGSVWLWLHTATLRAAQSVQEAQDRHLQVADLVSEIHALERRAGLSGTISGETARLQAPILIAARQITRDIGLEDKLISVRPALQATGRDGVQLYYERLTLPDLLALLETLEREGGMQTSTMTFNRRLDDPSLADLQLVLFR